MFASNGGRGAALLLALGLSVAPYATAGELTVGVRFGGTDLDVDGRYLESGDSISDRGLMAAGLAVAYRWERGAVLEATTLTSFDPFPIFGFSDLSHLSVGGGWQFDLGQWWRFTPKAGRTYTELDTQQEDIFAGGEPTERFNDLVPFAELSLEGRIAGKFGIGIFLRQNFEKFGDSQTVGVSLGWTFD
jgi:hypothetical protein